MQVLDNVQWPDEMPWSAEDFQRYDESSDGIFYSQPRLVTHIDDGAIGALTECARTASPQSCALDAVSLDAAEQASTHGFIASCRFYSSQLPAAGSQDAAVLDLCSRYAANVTNQLLLR